MKLALAVAWLAAPVVALWLVGCASPVSVTAPACSITAELRTSERISCTAEGVTVERASIAETVKASGGLLGGALRTLLGAP